MSLAIVAVAALLTLSGSASPASTGGSRPVTPASGAIGVVATWTNISGNVTGSIPATSLIAFDAHDNYTVSDGAVYRNGEWTADSAPNAAQGNAAMAYDPAIGGGGVILFNGAGNGSTWFFQGGNWTSLNTSGGLPTPPILSPSASQTGVTPLYSGYPMGGGDSWTMAFDAADGYLLLAYGGGPNITDWNCDSYCYGTISVWSLSNGSVWSSVASLPTTVLDDNPGYWGTQSAFTPALTYDAHDGYVVGVNNFGQTYSYSAGVWTSLNVNVAGNYGSMVYNESFAYDPQISAAIMFGGICETSADFRSGDPGGPCDQNPYGGGGPGGYNFTFVFQSGNWTNLSAPSGLAPRADAALAYDAADGYLLAVGGTAEATSTGATDPTVATETWVLSNSAVVVYSPVNHVRISATPSPTDVGTPVNLSISFTGGHAPFTYLWTNQTANWSTPGNGIVQTFVLSGTYRISATVTDYVGTYQTGSLDVTVNALPQTALAVPPDQTVGIPENFSGSSNNGTGPYAYAWNFGDGTNASAQNGTHAYRTNGRFVVTLTTTDTLGRQASANSTVTVAPTIVPTLAVSNTTPSLGQSVWFNLTIRGGLGPFRYVWSGLPDGCTSRDSPTIGCLPTEAGAYAVKVNVTDGYPGAATAAVNISVVFDFTLYISAATVAVGHNLTIGVLSTASGLSYSYTGLPPGCMPANSALLTCSPTAIGNYSITVTVTDAAGNSASRTFRLDVTATGGTAPVGNTPPKNGTTTPKSSGSPAWPMGDLLLVGVGVLVGVLIAGAAFWRWHRPARPGNTPSR
jgi:hypothetical protein